jgi:hypothetical protein
MAICNALSGVIAKSCDNNVGGVRKIWLTDFSTISYTLNGSKQITSISPSTQNHLVSNTATVNTTIAGPSRVITNITIPGGDFTSILTPGKQFRFTYNTDTGSGSWTGPVLTATYNAGPNTTTLTPDFGGFTPVVGLAANPAPNNTGNQTVNTFVFYEFEFNRNTSSYEEAPTVNLENGTTYFNQTVRLMLQRRESSKREAIEKLTAGQKKLQGIVLDSNGLYWLFGLQDGLYATEIGGGSGTAKTDMNGYQIVLTSEESLQAFECTSGAVAPFILNA